MTQQSRARVVDLGAIARRHAQVAYGGVWAAAQIVTRARAYRRASPAGGQREGVERVAEQLRARVVGLGSIDPGHARKSLVAGCGPVAVWPFRKLSKADNAEGSTT